MALSVVALCAGLILVLINQLINSEIAYQNRRNGYLQQNIFELDAKVAEIRHIRRKRTDLLDRIRVIQELQGDRSVNVRIIDQLVRTVPEGVFYTSLKLAGGRIAIEGVAVSNNQVSSLMRRMEDSDWLEGANLDAVKTAPDYGVHAMIFNLTVDVQEPTQEEEI